MKPTPESPDPATVVDPELDRLLAGYAADTGGECAPAGLRASVMSDVASESGTLRALKDARFGRVARRWLPAAAAGAALVVGAAFFAGDFIGRRGDRDALRGGTSDPSVGSSITSEKTPRRDVTPAEIEAAMQAGEDPPGADGKHRSIYRDPKGELSTLAGKYPRSEDGRFYASVESKRDALVAADAELAPMRGALDRSADTARPIPIGPAEHAASVLVLSVADAERFLNALDRNAAGGAHALLLHHASLLHVNGLITPPSFGSAPAPAKHDTNMSGASGAAPAGSVEIVVYTKS